MNTQEERIEETSLEAKRRAESSQSLRLIAQAYLDQLKGVAVNEVDVLNYCSMAAQMEPADFLDVVNQERAGC